VLLLRVGSEAAAEGVPAVVATALAERTGCALSCECSADAVTGPLLGACMPFVKCSALNGDEAAEVAGVLFAALTPPLLAPNEGPPAKMPPLPAWGEGSGDGPAELGTDNARPRGEGCAPLPLTLPPEVEGRDNEAAGTPSHGCEPAAEGGRDDAADDAPDDGATPDEGGVALPL